MKKTTFSENVKKEICGLVFEDHCLKALLSSFLTNRWTTVINSNHVAWRLTSQFPFIIDFLANAFQNLYDVKITKKLASNPNNLTGETNYIDVVGNFEQIESDLCLNERWDANNLCELDCCKRAYIAGAFLAGGSINSLESKSYHLEIRSSNYKYLVYQQALLASFNLYPVLTKHTKKQFILYLKKVDQISDFLKLVGAGNNMLAFEDKKISKDANMSITRWNNLDISNLNKSTMSGVKQIKQIKKIMSLPIYKKQPAKFKAFCELRLSHPSSSLSEMVDLMKEHYHIKTTRPGLNHLVRKLDRLYNKG